MRYLAHLRQVILFHLLMFATCVALCVCHISLAGIIHNGRV